MKNENFEPFFASLMKVSKGTADLSLLKFDQNDIVLAVDPGTRHFGFSLLEKGELPSLWFVNLKTNIENLRTHNTIKDHLLKELDLFLGNEKELINKIFVGNGPGSTFIIDFLIEYLNIPCENRECVKTDFEAVQENSASSNDTKKRFVPPDIFLVDEFKTSKEALFRLQQGKLVNEVQSKGFVDHAIAALLIAKRGLKGEIVKIEQKPLKELFDYVLENYAGSYSFKTMHNVNSLDDLKAGMHLKVKDSSKLDSNLNNGDIILFIAFGDAYQSVHASTLSGNKLIVKLRGNISLRREFFTIFVPVKERI